MYSIPFLCIILIIIIFTLSNSRGMFPYIKRKRRHSKKSSSSTPPITPVVKYIPNITRIPLDDDEELMKSEIILNFCDNNSIELRLEQDQDSDIDIN